MPFGVNQELAEATVRVLGNNVKLINWFQEVTDKFDKITEEIEKKLGETDNYFKQRKYNEALENIEFLDLLKTLRSSRRSRYGKVRDSLIWMIGQISRLKRMPAEDRPERAIINQFEVLNSLYTMLINEHIENTTMIEDKIVFQIERMTTDSARIYDLGMRPMIDSDETKGAIKSSKKDDSREKMLAKQMQLNPMGIAGILSGPSIPA